MKVCTKCGSEKAVSEFGKRSSTEDGIARICKSCHNGANNARNAKDPSKARARLVKWRSNSGNREKEKERLAMYRENNRSKVRERGRVWARNNIETTTRWAKENPELRRKVGREYARRNTDRSRRYNEENAEKIRITRRRWADNNRHRKNASEAAREAMKRNAVPKWANMFFLEEAYELAKLRTALHGFIWHVDHTVPLIGKIEGAHVVCGLHTESNIRVIPGKENMRKGNRYWPDMP